MCVCRGQIRDFSFLVNVSITVHPQVTFNSPLLCFNTSYFKIEGDLFLKYMILYADPRSIAEICFIIFFYVGVYFGFLRVRDLMNSMILNRPCRFFRLKFYQTQANCKLSFAHHMLHGLFLDLNVFEIHY